MIPLVQCRHCKYSVPQVPADPKPDLRKKRKPRYRTPRCVLAELG